MLLAIDVGNTHTVLGVFKDAVLAADWRLSSATNRTADELWLTLRNFCSERQIDPSTITGAGISSVVPDLTGIYQLMAQKYLHTEAVNVHAGLDLGMPVRYNDPSAVGADRLCNAVAGFRKYGGPLIIIDFGTATTYDVVSKDGEYLGGVIALGLESAAAELHRRAARLPRIELAFPSSVIGRDTVGSMQAGIMFGAVDAVEGTVARIRKELGAEARVIATGGLSPVVARHTKVIEACEPALVLEGIRLIFERQKHPPAVSTSTPQAKPGRTTRTPS
jgi:type III pantothenate kinase